MKHVFVINPSAGPEDATDRIKQALASCSPCPDYEIYSSRGPGDATLFVRGWLERNSDDVRFYACGGDGTLNEVVNGAVGCPRASVGCYPCGSGNDYIKYYGGKDAFLDIPSLIAAPCREVDIMKVNDRYCINVCNFGFDTAVARTMAKVRRNRLLGGKLAYPTGIAASLFTAMKTNCRMRIDGKSTGFSKLLLCTVANGSYVGSAFKCAPRSVNDDGLMEVCVVKPISIFKFFTMINSYKQGKHLEDPRFKDVIVYSRAESIELRAPSGFAVTLDGEIVEGTYFVIENKQRALRFAVPVPAPSSGEHSGAESSCQ